MTNKPLILWSASAIPVLAGVLLAVACATDPSPANPGDSGAGQPAKPGASGADEPANPGDSVSDEPVLKLTPLQAPSGVTTETLLSPEHALWTKASQIPLRLSRTPPLYAGGSRDEGHRPSASVRLVRLDGGDVVARLRWTDPTQDVSKRTKRIADVGADKVYSMHPLSVSGFADAVAVMVPQKRQPHRSYPSLMMGHEGAPVDLYFWRAGLGFQKLTAAGRGTTTHEREAKLAGNSHRDADGWTVVLPVGKFPQRTPVAFGIWDGQRGHRDGLKYFTVWYEVW